VGAHDNSRAMSTYSLVTDLVPNGDQPDAIRQLAEGVRRGTATDAPRRHRKRQDLHYLQRDRRPGQAVLVMSTTRRLPPSCTESSSRSSRTTASSSSSATTITTSPSVRSVHRHLHRKDASINDEIDRLRLRATSALLSGDRNVIVVASVSCIYGIGAPEEWASQVVVVRKGESSSGTTC